MIAYVERLGEPFGPLSVEVVSTFFFELVWFEVAKVVCAVFGPLFVVVGSALLVSNFGSYFNAP